MMQSYLSDRIFMDNPSNRPTSSNPVFYRLDARNPCQYCIRPTVQPFFRFFRVTCARACASAFFIFSIRAHIGWTRLDGWTRPVFMRPHTSNLFFTGWTRWDGMMGNKKEKGWMRKKMPDIADFIDRLREAFGEEYVNDIIRRGMAGEPVFYVEGKVDGKTVKIGTPIPEGVRITWDAVTGVSRLVEDEDDE